MRFSTLLPVAFGVLSPFASLAGAQVPASSADPEIQGIVSDISAERIQRSVYVLASFKTRHTLSDPLPSGDGIGGACAWIRAEFERVSAASGGRLKVELDSFVQKQVPPRIPHPVTIVNVVATLPGSRPDSAGRIYVMSGHYDSILNNVLDATSPAPGADDNASGVAAVLEAARVMSSHEFGATIVFMAVAGEEQGLTGSAHWAAQARDKGLDIAGMIDDDIVGNSRGADGRIDRHTVCLFAQGIRPRARLDDALVDSIRDGGENDSPARELARAVRDAAGIYAPSIAVRLVYRTDRYLGEGDQMSFLEQGYPAVRFTESAEDFRRERQAVRVENGVRYGDTPDGLDYVYAADVTRVNASALASLARAPAPPREVKIEMAPEAGTTLAWAPNVESDLAGYRIVWRETTAPIWEHSIDVTKDATQKTIAGLSKDGLIFGVEAFDTAGYASPASFAEPKGAL